MFRSNLRILREQRGFTQKELSEKLGVTAGTVGMWEQGRRTPPIATVERIAEVLSVTTADLIDSKGKELNAEKKQPATQAKEESKFTPGTEIELEEMNIFLRIPKEAVALEVTASLILDGELRKVGTKLSVSDIRDRRQDFLDNVEDGDDYDARYVLTDEGRAYLEELMEDDE